MELIKKIEIKHFRSIHDVVIDDLSHINVFSGLNDVGKSNVIKALNVFFNNEVERNTAFNFETDTSSWHSHRSSAGHSKKLVTIRLTFRRPARYREKLPDLFWIERYWDLENQNQAKTTWGSHDFEKSWDDRPRALTEFMNRSHFFYVPAIRDRDYFRHLLSQFSRSITDKASSELESAGETLSTVLSDESSSLRASLKELTNLNFVLKLPDSLLALLEASGLYTVDDKALELRGDGIQGLAVASILAYLTNVKRRDFYYWGFEEPENSLEYINSTKLAQKMESTYSRKAQLFMSTHSPAFLSMENRRTSTYRVSKRLEPEYHGHAEEVSAIQPVFLGDHASHTIGIVDELGFFELVRSIDREYRDYERNKVELEDKLVTLREATKPLLIVEGIHDRDTLEHAWKRLSEDPIPFDILPADGESKLGDLVVQLYRLPRKPRVVALVDHDIAGIDRFGKLSRSICGKEPCMEDLTCCSGEFLIMTLPVPTVPDRTEQASNRNLTMEFYFPDDFLWNIDQESGKNLFRRDKFILNGMHKDIDEASLDFLLENGKKTIVHLLPSKNGKQLLVKKLSKLPDSDFTPFHTLFYSVMLHLCPGSEMNSSPNVGK